MFRPLIQVFKIITENSMQKRFTKGSKAAKEFMAKLRSKRKNVGAIKIVEKGESASSRPTATYQYKRTAKGTFKGLKRISGSHKDSKSHNVNVRVVSGIIGIPDFSDPNAAREIELYAENDGDLYRQQRRPILINLTKKYKKGTYDVQKALKLWRYFIDSAMKKYNKEFGSRGDKWFDLLSTSDRQLLAEKWAKETKEEFDLGNFVEN